MLEAAFRETVHNSMVELWNEEITAENVRNYCVAIFDNLTIALAIERISCSHPRLFRRDDDMQQTSNCLLHADEILSCLLGELEMIERK